MRMRKTNAIMQSGGRGKGRAMGGSRGMVTHSCSSQSVVVFLAVVAQTKRARWKNVTWQSDARLPSFVVLQPVSVLCCLLIGATGGRVQQGLALLIRGKATRE